MSAHASDVLECLCERVREASSVVERASATVRCPVDRSSMPGTDATSPDSPRKMFATHRRGYRRARDAGTRDFRSATAARTFSATLPKRLQKITDVAASSGRFRRRIKEMFARAPESRTCSGCASRATGVRDAWRRIAPLESSPSLGRRSTVVAHGVASKAQRIRGSRRPPHRSRGRVAERFIARDARAHIARDVMRCPRSRRRNGTARVDRGVA